MKINLKKLILSIIIPLSLGIFIGFLTRPYNNYDEIVLPTFSPPGILFPIVWTILYILMGISYYLVSDSYDILKSNAKKIYICQLIVNLLWSIIFFILRNYFLSLVWILLLLILIIIMIIKFSRINRISAYLQIPYLFWTSFATVLTYFVYLLN